MFQHVIHPSEIPLQLLECAAKMHQVVHGRHKTAQETLKCYQHPYRQLAVDDAVAANNDDQHSSHGSEETGKHVKSLIRYFKMLSGVGCLCVVSRPPGEKSRLQATRLDRFHSL